MEFFEKNQIEEKKINKEATLLIVILLLQIYQIINHGYQSYQIKKDPALQVGEIASDFCFYTTKSLIDGTFSWKMFDEVTYKGLKAEANYFDFADDEKVKLVKVQGDQCRVLTESNGRIKGLLMTLNSNTSNPLYYKAIQISEEENPTESGTN